MRLLLINLLTKVRQRFCQHHCFLEDLTRRADGQVEVQCVKCGKMLVAPYGLALGCDWLRKKK